MDVNVIIGTNLQRVVDYVFYVEHLFSTPIQIFLCIVVLSFILGYSALAGVALFCAMVPIQSWLGAIPERKQDSVTSAIDARGKKIDDLRLKRRPNHQVFRLGT